MTESGPPRQRTPPLPHQLRRNILGGKDADHWRLGREGAHFGDEGGGRGHREMGAHGVDALPLLDEHQPVGVLDVDMAIVRETPRLRPRPRAMLGAERDHALAMLGVRMMWPVIRIMDTNA